MRLRPQLGASLARLPGAPPPRGGALALLFAAGAAIWSQDLFAAYWREEAGTLDWKADFLCDPATDALFERLSAPDEDEAEDDEILYSKSYLTTLGSEIMDDV